MNFHPLSSLLRLVPPRPHREVVVPLGTTVDCENVTLGSAELSGHVQVCGGTPANRLQMLRLLCTSTLAAGWDVLVVESAPENSRVGPMFGHTHELATQHDVQFHLANSDGHFFDTDGV